MMKVMILLSPINPHSTVMTAPMSSNLPQMPDLGKKGAGKMPMVAWYLDEELEV